MSNTFPPPCCSHASWSSSLMVGNTAIGVETTLNYHSWPVHLRCNECNAAQRDRLWKENISLWGPIDTRLSPATKEVVDQRFERGTALLSLFLEKVKLRTLAFRVNLEILLHLHCSREQVVLHGLYGTIWSILLFALAFVWDLLSFYNIVMSSYWGGLLQSTQALVWY